MRFGICIGGDFLKIAPAKRCGYDYVESAFEMLANAPSQQFSDFADELKKNDIPCESVNCFLPGSLKVVGPQVDHDALHDYVKRGMENGERLGVKTVVFGSGGARSIPEGFPYAQAIRQLVTFLKEIAGPLAAGHGITLTIEPLCDCNVITTVKEGAILAAMADMPSVRSLGDLYHMEKVGDTCEDVLALKGMLKHAHIAEPSQRIYPTLNDAFDYRPFVRALEEIGCPRCSLEARNNDFEKEAKAAMDVFRSL